VGPAATLDLNADLGEGAGGDEAVMAVVTTAHIACGGHAGDRGTMARAVALAVAAGVAVGAHPSYPDPAHFGRRDLDLPLDEVLEAVAGQVAALRRVARAAGATVVSVKPHGALYHRLSARPDEAVALAAALADGPDPPRLVLAAGSPGLAAAAGALAVVGEAFCDRAYRADGGLVDRAEEGAVLTDPAEAARRAVSLATAGTVPDHTGGTVRLAPGTLCLHGDTPGAAALARAVRAALEGAGVALAPPR
jgi:UPF0271 protein